MRLGGILLVIWLIIGAVAAGRSPVPLPASDAAGPGGIEFNEDDTPQYSDFAHLAFTIGMTFQVSGINIGSEEIRRTALRSFARPLTGAC
jgi:Protein of unknown function (DUF1345)